MSKKSTRWTSGEDAAEEVEEVPGGTEGNTELAPIPADTMTEQEKAATEVPGDPKQPYPTGNPPSAEDEKRRAMGLPREETEAEADANPPTAKEEARRARGEPREGVEAEPEPEGKGKR
jgi:hypothetical protein